MVSARAAHVIVPLAFVALAACAGATSQTRFGDAETLLAEREEWRGDKSGAVVLRLHVEGVVDTRTDPAKAESALVVHVVAADYGGGSGIPFTFPVPGEAQLESVKVRVLTATEPPAPARLRGEPVRTTPDPGDIQAVDPDQALVGVTLPSPPAGGVVEAILRYRVPGTLVADAWRLGVPGTPVGEMLLRYDLAGDTVGTFQTTHPAARPVVTTKDGRRLIALLLSKLPPATAETPIARYVTLSASPKGFDQTFSADWARATDVYREQVVEVSDSLGAGFEVPYEPSGSGRAQVLDALAWVRARPLRAGHADPFSDVRFDAARPLPAALQANDLTAVDRVHLMHWILREAGIPHEFAMARAGARPPLDPGFPTPGAFDAPLIHLPDLGGLVVDPACDACAPGEVRPSLRGGQALVVPVAPGTRSVTFIPLPTTSAAP